MPAVKVDPKLRAFLEATIVDAGALLQSLSRAGLPRGPSCDQEISRFLVQAIKGAYPEHGYLSEQDPESGVRDEPALTWIIDPIDGSENFYRGILPYSVSISLVRGDDILLGAVYEPYLSRLFLSEKGKGAWLNGCPIRVSPVADLSRAVVAVSRYGSFACGTGYECSFLRIVEELNVRISASTALDLCYVACGAIEGRIMANTRRWDYSAASLLLQEAGGTVTDWAGRRAARAERRLLASNGHCHSALLRYLGTPLK